MIFSVKKYWTTEKGEEIEYTKLEDSHLLNILRFVKRRAKEGIIEAVSFGYENDNDFMGGDIFELDENEALEKMDYKGLLKEVQRRKLLK